MAKGTKTGLAVGTTTKGRFPANLIHDGSDEVVSLFPESKSGKWNGHRTQPKTRNTYGTFALQDERGRRGDSGSAARFFYCAKASGTDRGNHTVPAAPLFGEAEETFVNDHPTVKPVALIRYLIRLITPPGGLVLDPFAGSATTGIASIEEGFRCICIEKESMYCKIGIHRVKTH